MKKHNKITGQNLTARGEPFLWTMGGALAVGILMVAGFLCLVIVNGLTTFYPVPVYKLNLNNSKIIAGEPVRKETFKTDSAQSDNRLAERTLYKTGNFDLYNEDYMWVADYEINKLSAPKDIFFIERMEWGPFIGFIKALQLDKNRIEFNFLKKDIRLLEQEHSKALQRRKKILKIEKKDLGRINHFIEEKRLDLRKIEIKHGDQSKLYKSALQDYQKNMSELKVEYEKIRTKVDAKKNINDKFLLILEDVNGTEKIIKLSDIVRFYPANSITFFGKIKIYCSRWYEFLTTQPREANTEGGVLPAIFGTVAMTLLMVIFVAPFGIMASLYLREYAKQGRMVSLVKVCVNNLAGVPSIVYGVFGLGFFAYIIGGSIDNLFFQERLPNPVFGTGGILWASLTLALLTVPVVIVATEEALAAVPTSLREGSLACGASKWQTIKNIVLPKAMPGILTGLILAMARGAGEVAPLMLVGVVKLAPELPVDGYFPFVHLERSFMHLGFHIFDVGFQSRNAEAGKPMVFVTTLLLIFLIAVMNAAAIYIRGRLKRRYMAGHF
ncbi:MAG: phosphate ABC transporter permease PstA [Desulfosarcina sp.]|nr:phosphate ABC transporter permease PstA [Desulfobacterales bacterium]